MIADDVFYFEEPFFQDGPVAVAVNEVVEGGATYFSAAGNDNLLDAERRTRHRLLGNARTTATPAAVHPRFRRGLAPTASTASISIPTRKNRSDLWHQSGTGVGTDDRPAVGRTLERRRHRSRRLPAQRKWHPGRRKPREDNVETTQMPVEVLSWTNESSAGKTVQLVVNRALGEAEPRVKLA